MIANLRAYINRRSPLWEEYRDLLDRLESNDTLRLDLEEVRRLRFLHESVAGDLSRIRSQTVDPETVQRLESLLARGFGFVHDGRGQSDRPALRSLPGLFAQVVRKQKGALLLVVLAFLLGGTFGGVAVAIDPSVKDVIMPFPHLLGDPADRVAKEEASKASVSGYEGRFAAKLMTHNIRVSITAFVVGIAAGVLTLVMVFYNGVILGAVVVDYVLAGQGRFLTGWLLPHGSVEIPAILFAAQAGLLLARAVLVREGRLSLSARLRAVRGDVLTLMGGVAVLLVWAGIVEAFFSQYHEPVLPYEVKILFGVLQSAGLTFLLLIAGRKQKEETE